MILRILHKSNAKKIRSNFLRQIYFRAKMSNSVLKRAIPHTNRQLIVCYKLRQSLYDDEPPLIPLFLFIVYCLLFWGLQCTDEGLIYCSINDIILVNLQNLMYIPGNIRQYIKQYNRPFQLYRPENKFNLFQEIVHGFSIMPAIQIIMLAATLG